MLDAMVHVAYEFPSDAPMATVKLVMHSFVESTGPKSAAALNAALALGLAVEAWLSDAAATAGPPADFTRVSMPQSSTIWTVYDNPGDLVRLVLGMAACIWIGIQLFTVPKDPHSYGAWFYIGLVAVPFALICVAGIW